MADAPVTLSQHIASQRGALDADHAPGVAAVLEQFARVAVDIANELAHAALRGRLGLAGDTNVTGDVVKKLDGGGARGRPSHRHAEELLDHVAGDVRVAGQPEAPAERGVGELACDVDGHPRELLTRRPPPARGHIERSALRGLDGKA